MPSSRTWWRWSNLMGWTIGSFCPVIYGVRTHPMSESGAASAPAIAAPIANRKSELLHCGKSALNVFSLSGQ
jgi:hypothetical protein